MTSLLGIRGDHTVHELGAGGRCIPVQARVYRLAAGRDPVGIGPEGQNVVVTDVVGQTVGLHLLRVLVVVLHVADFECVAFALDVGVHGDTDAGLFTCADLTGGDGAVWGGGGVEVERCGEGGGGEESGCDS